MQLLSEYFRKDGASAEVLVIDGFYAIMYYNDEDMLCEVVEFKNNTLQEVYKKLKILPRIGNWELTRSLLYYVKI